MGWIILNGLIVLGGTGVILAVVVYFHEDEGGR